MLYVGFPVYTEISESGPLADIIHARAFARNGSFVSKVTYSIPKLLLTLLTSKYTSKYTSKFTSNTSNKIIPQRDEFGVLQAQKLFHLPNFDYDDPHTRSPWTLYTCTCMNMNTNE